MSCACFPSDVGFNEHISPWKSAWRGAPGRPRVPWLRARFPSQGVPSPAAAHLPVSRSPGRAPIWGWWAACGWPGAGAGALSLAPPPTHTAQLQAAGPLQGSAAHASRVPAEAGQERPGSLFRSPGEMLAHLQPRAGGRAGANGSAREKDAARIQPEASGACSQPRSQASYTALAALSGHGVKNPN